MVGLFKSETYDAFKDKKEGAELVKGEAQPNVLIKCSVNLSSKLKEKDELATDISIDDAIDGFDTNNIDEQIYVENNFYLDYDNKRGFYEVTTNTYYHPGRFSYTVDGNKVTCTFVVFDENKGNGLVKNKLVEVPSVRTINIQVDNTSKWYTASDIKSISPKLYDYIVKNIT